MKLFSKLITILMLTCGATAMGAAVIFSGSDVKTLKSNIDLNGQSKILSGSVDPTSSATSAPFGSLYLNSSTGFIYKKLDSGSSTNWEVVGSSSGEGGFNLLSNPGFELGSTTGWTNSGGTYAVVTSGANLLFQTKSVTLNASATGQYVESTAYTVPVGLQGTNCVARIHYLGGDTNLKMDVIDNGAVVISTTTFSGASTTTTSLSANFICPTSGTIKLRVESTADAAIVALDRMYLGGADNLSQISQASFYGGVIWPATTNCGWTRTAQDSFADFSADTDCTTPVGNNLLGNGAAPATKIPAVTFNNMPAGDYYITAIGEFFVNASNTQCAFRFSDGTDNTSPQIIYNNAGLMQTPVISGRLSYSSSATRTISIQATAVGASADCRVVSALQNNLQILVYRFPTSTETAYNAGQSPASWSGSLLGAGGGWTTTSSSYADVAVATTSSTLTTLTNTNMSVIAEATKLPAITFTPTRAGSYQVCANVTVTNTASDNTNVRMVDGAGTVIAAGVGNYPAAANAISAATLCGISNLTSTAAATYKIQMLVASGTGQVSQATNHPITWMIVALNQSFPAPLLVNSVVSPSAGIVGVATASIGGATVATSCTASPCTVYNSTGTWISSATRASTGNYTINFTAGYWSGVPQCFYSSLNNSAPIGMGQSSGASTSSWPIYTIAAGGTQTDERFSVFCIGPH